MRGRAHAPVASLGETQVLPAQPPITVGSKYFQGLRPRKRPGGHHGQMGEHPAACPSDNTASCHKATDPSTQAEGQQPQPNRALLSSASSVTRHRQRGWTALNILEARVPHTSDGRVTCQAITTIQMKTKNCKTNEKKKKSPAGPRQTPRAARAHRGSRSGAEGPAAQHGGIWEQAARRAVQLGLGAWKLPRRRRLPRSRAKLT